MRSSCTTPPPRNENTNETSRDSSEFWGLYLLLCCEFKPFNAFTASLDFTRDYLISNNKDLYDVRMHQFVPR